MCISVFDLSFIILYISCILAQVVCIVRRFSSRQGSNPSTSICFVTIFLEKSLWSLDSYLSMDEGAKLRFVGAVTSGAEMAHFRKKAAW